MQRHLGGVPQLNPSAVLTAAGPDYTDKELVDNIAHGVRMPVDHEARDLTKLSSSTSDH
jgi:hypothetical protein